MMYCTIHDLTASQTYRMIMDISVPYAQSIGKQAGLFAKSFVLKGKVVFPLKHFRETLAVVIIPQVMTKTVMCLFTMHEQTQRAAMHKNTLSRFCLLKRAKVSIGNSQLG